MHLKAYYLRIWNTECILRPTIQGLGLLFKGLEHGMDLEALGLGHGMHLKAYYSRAWGHGVHLKAYYLRIWNTECILRPTIQGLGLLFKGLEHGMDLEA